MNAPEPGKVYALTGADDANIAAGADWVGSEVLPTTVDDLVAYFEQHPDDKAGPGDLFDRLTKRLGTERGTRLWNEACEAFDRKHAPDEFDVVLDHEDPDEPLKRAHGGDDVMLADVPEPPLTAVFVHVDDGLKDVVLFTDGTKARAFADDIFPNDALLGISEVVVEAVPTDEAAVEAWWAKVNSEFA